jgi:hypothetical protein
MTKVRPEALVETWAAYPDVFELEPKHIRVRFAAQVAAARKKMEAASAKKEDAVSEPESKPGATKAPAKKKEEPEGGSK